MEKKPMPTVAMNAKKVAGLKPIPGKRVEYFDADTPGLALRITERGAKSWTLFYRHRGRLRRMTLGGLDVVGLAKARKLAKDHLYAASQGEDPATQKQEDKRAQTFGPFAATYLEQHAKRHKKSWKADEHQLRLYVLPAWKH